MNQYKTNGSEAEERVSRLYLVVEKLRIRYPIFVEDFIPLNSPTLSELKISLDKLVGVENLKV